MTKTKSGGYAARAKQSKEEQKSNALAVELANKAKAQRVKDDAMAAGIVETEPDAAIRESESSDPPHEKTAPIRERGSRYGLQPGLQRFTITTETALIDKLKDYAYTERLSLKDAVTQMFHAFLDDKMDLIRDPKRK